MNISDNCNPIGLFQECDPIVNPALVIFPHEDLMPHLCDGAWVIVSVTILATAGRLAPCRPVEFTIDGTRQNYPN